MVHRILSVRLDVIEFAHRKSPYSVTTAWYEEKIAGVQDGGIPGRSFYTSLGHLNETWHVST